MIVIGSYVLTGIIQ